MILMFVLIGFFFMVSYIIACKDSIEFILKPVEKANHESVNHFFN